MRKTTFILLLLLMLFGSSCEEDSKPYYSYENVVDSTFYCEVTIDGETQIFDNQLRNSAVDIRVRDSILLGFDFNYGNSGGLFTIRFYKFFPIEDLENLYEFEDEWYFADCLEEYEFLSVFQEENLQYCKYNYDEERMVSDGISILFSSYGESIWLTEYTALYIENESIDSFYENANFNITNLEILDENNIIIECSFNLEIFGEYAIDGKKNLSNGYFKGYYTNLYTNCR